MTIRRIRLFGDPVLGAVADAVTSFDASLRRLVDDLMDTTSVPGRAGVAAPQIGVSKRVFSYNVDGNKGYIVNPVLEQTSGGTVELDEGCLSLPGMWRPTPRFRRVTVSGFDCEGLALTVSGRGVLAQCLQHEIDHLDGLVYINRLTKKDYRLALREVRNSDWFWQKDGD